MVFNEIHYNPTDQKLEFVELRNQLYVNVDVSGWRFQDGITYDFPEGTVIPARGYLVVAKSPADLQAATGYAGALGPFSGSLSNDGEKLTLYNNGHGLRTRPSSATQAAANQLWSVDIEGDGNGGAYGQTVPGKMSGPEGSSGLGNVWNEFKVRGHDGVSINPSLANLVDSSGAVSGVSFSITGQVSGFSYGGDALYNDYLFLQAGNSAASVTWQIAGLDAAKVYSLWLYGSSSRSCLFKVDVNGNGSLTDETTQTAPGGGGVLISGIQPDSTGKISGSATAPAGSEGNWAGLQVFIPGVVTPAEPGTFSSGLEARRLMDEVDYSDSAPWPIAPDGSGFTLAKKDPQTTGALPANWTWSLQRNGTPGAVNFPTGGTTLPKIAFNEVSGAGDTPFLVELHNYDSATLTLTGYSIAGSDHPTPYTFPTTTLAANGYLVLDQAALGFTPANNERLFLLKPGATGSLIDAVKIAGAPRARYPADTGAWLRPSGPTFGAANTFALQGDVVINEIFHSAFDYSAEEWVELYNKGATAVDLSGWKLTSGITYTFPAGTTLAVGAYLVIANDPSALLAKWPGRPIVGPFTGGLGDGDSIVLTDATGNPANSVSYQSGGRWPRWSDRGGSSMELRDPRADNSVAEAWASSSTQALGSWQTVTYTGVATNDGYGIDAFNDFLLGMLDTGEILLDDVSVREDPAGANTEFIQNGTFDADTVGTVPAHWRCLGNHGSHGLTVVAADPDQPGNKCLHVVATGNTEDKSNRIETTFFSGKKVTVGNTYKISFRARWLAGSNQVNTRLYLNFLQKTTLLPVGNKWGTPGAVNSARVANIGPTASNLTQLPVRPAVGQPTAISVTLNDPDGVANAVLRYRVRTGTWLTATMTAGAAGRYTGTVPAQAAGALVQFYVSATDATNGSPVSSTFPAAGAKSGAFFRVQDSTGDSSGLRGNVRVLVSPETETLLFTNTNRMSNDDVPGTVIDDEATPYYDIGVRLKGSGYGRYASTDYGYDLSFQPDQPFRGVHGSVSIERSGSLREIVAEQILNRVGGGYWSFYNDVVKINGPGGASDVALVAASRTSKVFVESLFPGYRANSVFNHELLYQPLGTTDGNPESLKLNNPYTTDQGALELADYGPDKEAYRWGWQIRSERRLDDYSQMIRLCRAFALSGSAFQSEIEATMDIDQWMRTWAMMGLYGNDDQYGRLYQHNWRLYPRPTDGRMLALPWDLDRTFNLSSTDQLTPPNGTIAKLFTVPAFKRAFDSNVLDLVNSGFNTTYMNGVITHLSSVTGQDFSSLGSYIGSRSGFALTQLPASVPFAITTNGGADFTTSANSVTLQGTGWVDVYAIQRSGQTAPLAVTWTSSTTWSVSVSLTSGVNAITLQAMNQVNTVIGTASINITSNTANVPATASNIVISELHYHPAAPSQMELMAGYKDADDFQFIELQNIGLSSAELAGAQFTQGITFTFTGSTVLGPGQCLVLARNPAALALRSSAAVAGTFQGTLSHSGETLTLQNASGTTIKSFAYSDHNPWPSSADGEGYSLILLRPATNPNHGIALNWSSSASVGGQPGMPDTLTYADWLLKQSSLTDTDPFDDPEQDGFSNIAEYAQGTDPMASSPALAPQASSETLTVNGVAGNYLIFHFRRAIGVSQALFIPEASSDLKTWSSAETVLAHQGSFNNGDGSETVSFRSTPPSSGALFMRLRVEDGR